MSRLSSFVLALAVLVGGCVVYPYDYPPTVVPGGPASFDLSWNAALGAASDAGVQVTSADRGTGVITGSKAGAAVTITLRQQGDGSLRVAFQAPDAKETNPTLNDRWLAAYNRRMGR